jgi:hypothetical protein
VRPCHLPGFFADGPVFEHETVMAMVSIFVRMVLTPFTAVLALPIRSRESGNPGNLAKRGTGFLLSQE